MADEVLNVLGGDALREKVGDDHGPEAVRGDDVGKPGRLEAPLEDRADGPGLEGPRLEGVPAGGERAKEGSVSVIAGGRQVGGEPFVQVVTDGDLAFAAALLAEPEGAEAAQIAEVLEPEVGDGADAGAGVGQGAEERPVADTGGLGQVEGLQEGPGVISGVLPSWVERGGPRTDWKGLRRAA